jgi:hypothetical protein
MNKLASRLGRRFIGMAFIACVVPSVAMVAAMQNAGASAPPSLNVSPPGSYHDGQTISVGVAPNSYFQPHARIVIIECADPGGIPSNLPKDDTTCDGNTVQGNTILVGGDGSFSQSAYTVYLLPSPTLGEQSNNQPICNQSNYCVLYVGQNQNDFTAPKVFSVPFLIAPSAGSSGATSTSTGSSGSSDAASSGSSGTTGTKMAPTSSASTGADAAVSLTTSATLANTGPPAQLGWVVVVGIVLLLSGVVGRRLVLRGDR